MKVYTYSEARQRFAEILDRARREGAVRIRRKDGSIFILKPDTAQKSPLDVPGLDLPLSAEEIVEFVHAGRRKP